MWRRFTPLLAPLLACAGFEASPPVPGPPDAGPDGGDALLPIDDAGERDAGAKLCATSHALCDDFDGVDFLPASIWTEISDANAALSASPEARSAPTALRVVATQGNARGWVRKSIAVDGAKGIACTFAVRVTAAVDLTFFAIDTFASTSDSTSVSTLQLGAFKEGDGRVIVREPTAGEPLSDDRPLASIGADGWHLVSVSWEFGARVVVDIGGVPKTSNVIAPITLGPTSVARVDVRVGVSVNSPTSGAREALYDDVVCDLVR